MFADRKSVFSIFVLYLFPVFSYLGYNYVGFNIAFIKLCYFVFIPILFVYLRNELLFGIRKSLYFNPVRNIFIAMFFSIIMAWLFWDQPLILGYRSTAPILAIIYFFFLYKENFSLQTIEKLIWIFAGIFIVLWMYGIYKAPEVVFGIDTNVISNNRGVFRFSLPGRACLVMAFFLAITKYINSKKNIYIYISIIFFLFIVLQVTRQIILFSALVAVFYYLGGSKKKWIYFLLFIFFVFLILRGINFSDDSIIGKLFDISQTELEEQRTGTENIRITEYKYFLFDYSKNLVTTIFGNGVPHQDCAYGQYELYLAKVHGLYLSDVGYANLFVYLGIVGLILYGILFSKIIIQSVPSKYMYAKLFLFYQIPANLAASWIFHDIIMICISIYILDKCQRMQK